MSVVNHKPLWNNSPVGVLGKPVRQFPVGQYGCTVRRKTETGKHIPSKYKAHLTNKCLRAGAAVYVAVTAEGVRSINPLTGDHVPVVLHGGCHHLLGEV